MKVLGHNETKVLGYRLCVEFVNERMVEDPAHSLDQIPHASRAKKNSFTLSLNYFSDLNDLNFNHFRNIFRNYLG